MNRSLSPAVQGSPTICSRFGESVRREGSRPAVTFAGESITYSDLDRLSNGIANRLWENGVRPGTRVGLAMERNTRLVAAILGILKSGAAYVPIDPTYPQQRIALIAEDAGVPVVICDQASRDALSGVRVPLLDADAIGPADSAPAAHFDGATPAYVIYTSGSTGKPKGVVVTHRNVVRLFDSTWPWFHFDSGDVWTLFHSYAFDFSVWEIWGALFYGGRVVVVPYTISRSPADFHRLCVNERVTVLNQTPSAFYQFMQADEASAGNQLSLRCVVFGGEALDFRALRKWFDRHGDSRPRLVNMYGITETTVHVTYRPISLADLESESRSAIGVPIPDLGLHLLDQNFQPVKTGEVGQICVTGAGVTEGYLNRPELTTERFPQCPPALGSGRMYCSGDLGKLLPDGDIEYLGRADMQVKVRGHRIELGEIEAQIVCCPGVHAACVVANQREDGNTFLTGFYVADSQGREQEEQIRRFLHEKLPVYMHPARLVGLDKLPLTEHGKADRRHLTEMAKLEQAAATAAVPAVSDGGEGLEDLVAACWTAALGHSDFSRNENFFDAGGDSILIVQLHAELTGRIPSAQVSVVDLFAHPTVESLARFLSGGKSALADAVAARMAKRRGGREAKVGS